MSRRTEYRNELKTRVDDDLYDAIQAYRRNQYIESDAATVNRLLRMALFGLAGNVRCPPDIVRPNLGHVGPRETA